MNCEFVSTKAALKLMVVLTCSLGFTYQTMQFLLLYWTYPTVLDIQQSIVSETDLPGISFCNSDAVEPTSFCKLKTLCIPSFLLNYVKICRSFPEICPHTGRMPNDLTIVAYHDLLRKHDLNVTVLQLLKKNVESFMSCKIIRGVKKFECPMEDILVGSYFSDTPFFNLCYTMNSLWGKPKKKIPRIGKYDKIVLDFYVELTGRGTPHPSQDKLIPKFNYPGISPSIQLSVHSPYITASPYSSGLGFLGGKHYKVKLHREDKHLLPLPYQTNCTDYMSNWISRGGIGPLNSLMVIEECKLNKTLKLKGCVPFSIDYPHNETVCKHCSNCTELSDIADECSSLLDSYNQPCDFTSYEMLVEEKNIQVKKVLKNVKTGQNETLIVSQKGFNCTHYEKWTQKCNRLKIEIVFDDFLVSNMTYNPKIEFVGLSVLILAIKMKWALSVLMLTNIPIVLHAVEAMTATGFFVSLSGFTGLCGACCENRWLLLGYLISLGIIVVMEFSVVVTLMIVKKTVSAALETPDCNSVCSASIDAAILEYALPSAGLIMTVMLIETLMIYCSIKLYFFVRDNPKATTSGPPVFIQEVQMRNVLGSHSTYVTTPQPMYASRFEYSPHHFQTLQVTEQATQQSAEEDKPPDYNSLRFLSPTFTDTTASGTEGTTENMEPNRSGEVFNRV